MGKLWTEKLLQSEVAYANSIIEQIPEDYGARARFIDIMQKLSDDSNGPKFRYIIAGESDVQGTNDLIKARKAAEDESYYVIDCTENAWLMDHEDDGQDSDITEVK